MISLTSLTRDSVTLIIHNKDLFGDSFVHTYVYLIPSASAGHVSDPSDPDDLRDRSFPDPGVHRSAELGGRQPAAGSLRVSR